MKKLFSFIACCLVLALSVIGAPIAHADGNNNYTSYPLPAGNSGRTTDPHDIALGADGNMWFTVSNTSKIGKIDTSGNVTEYSTPTADSAPTTITSGPGGMWFTEASVGQIGRIAPDGTITEFPLPPVTGQSAPEDIVEGPQGVMWFTYINDIDNSLDVTGSIGSIDSSSGTVTMYPDPYGDLPQNLTFGPDGALWFTEQELEGSNSYIGRMSTAGDFSHFQIPSANAAPNYITTGPDGALWFTEFNTSSPKIGRVTTSGAFTEYPVPGFNSVGYKIIAGPDGALWFADYGNGIDRITTDGLISQFPINDGYPAVSSLVFGPDGGIWFTEEANNSIGRIDMPEAGPANLTAASPALNPALSWDPYAGANSYNIYANGQLIGSSTDPNFTDTRLAYGDNAYNVTAVTDDGETLPSNTVHVIVAQSPAITTADDAQANVRSSFDFQIQTTGVPIPALSETGALPSGVSFTDNGDGTADISGIPAATAAGSYPLTITADNGSGQPATQNFTLTVASNPVAPSFASANSDNETFSVPFNFTVQTNGFPVPKLTKTGALPSGVTFKDNGDGTASISGTPAQSAIGVYNLTLSAKSGSTTVTQAFTLTIFKSPVISKLGTKTVEAGVDLSIPVKVSAYLPPQVSASGLPANVQFEQQSDGTFGLNGTPQPGTGGSYTVTLSATNASGTGTMTFTLKVDEAPAFNSDDQASSTTGQSFNFQLSVTGFPKPALSKTGTLPAGITFKAATGTFSGTPKAGSAGTYPITITAKNSSGTTTQNFTITVS